MGKKYVVLGSSGMLGQSIVEQLNSQRKTVIGLARKNADVCVDALDSNILLDVLCLIKPNIIINTIAIVDLQYCQKNPNACYATNARISLTLSRYCLNNNIKYVYISTDHYFTGGKNKKYPEDASVNLCNEYSISKYLGEKFSLTNQDAMIVRTNIVGFRGQENNSTFVEWAIQALKCQKSIDLFDNVFTSSIDTKSFSKALLTLIDKDTKGVINLASSEVSSKKQFIVALANMFNLSLDNTQTVNISLSDQIPNRNESLGLDVSKAEKILGYSLPNLTQVIQSLSQEYLHRNSKNDKQ